MKRILAILPLRVFAALCFAATLAGCAGNAGNGAFPSASPEIPAPAETSEIHRQQLAQALGNPALADSIAGQAPDALPQISHTPDILDKNPFASPQPPAQNNNAPFARQSVPRQSDGYKGFEIPFPVAAPLMTIAVWISEGENNTILIRLNVFILESALLLALNIIPSQEPIAVPILPPAPKPDPDPDPQPEPEPTPKPTVAIVPDENGLCPAGSLPPDGKTQAELNRELRLAARGGNVNAVCEWLRRGANADDTLNDAEESILHEAVRGGHLEVVKLLTANNALPNSRKEGAGPSPLDVAAQNENEEIAFVLREAGAVCFLEKGVVCGDPPVVAVPVVTLNPNPEPPTIQILDPSVYSSVTVVTVIAIAPDEDGLCPAGSAPVNGLTQAELNNGLRLAARNGNADEVCGWLRRGADVDDTLNGAEESILHEAVRGGHLEVVKLLAAHKPLPNSRKEGAGPSPLDVAAQNDNAPIASALRGIGGLCYLEKDKSPLCEDAPVVVVDPPAPTIVVDPTPKPEPKPEPEPEPETACAAGTLPDNGMSQAELFRELYLSVWRMRLSFWGGNEWGEAKRHEICGWLRRGAPINGHSAHRSPVLHLAAKGVGGSDSPEVAQFLIDNGADVNFSSGEIAPPLHYAAKWANSRAAKVLLANGAKVNAKNHEGKTALHVAPGLSQCNAIGSHPHVADGKAGVLPFSGPSYADISDSEKTERVLLAEALLNAGANVEAKTYSGLTPLHSAAAKGDPQTALLLLKHRANVYAQSDNGETPLDIARTKYWNSERNSYVLEVFSGLRARVNGYAQVMEVLQAAQRDAEAVAIDDEGGATPETAEDLTERFANAINAGAAFGDSFGGSAGTSAPFVARLNSLMRASGGDVGGLGVGWEVENDFGRAWFSTGARGDFGFGAGVDSDSEWGGGDLVGSPFAGLAGSGLLAGGETGLGEAGSFRVAAFGDFERGELWGEGEGGAWANWAAEGAGVGRAVSAAEGLSAAAGDDLRSRGAMAEIHLNGGAGEIALQAGAVGARGWLHSGADAAGDLRGLRSRTAFAGVSGAADLFGGWRLRGAAHVGRSWALSDGILARGDAWSSAFAAGVERGNLLYAGDDFIVRLSQPLRVERWETELTGGEGRRIWDSGYGPSGRQLDLDAAYRLPLSGGGRLLLSAGARSDSGHSEKSGVEGAALFLIEREF